MIDELLRLFPVRPFQSQCDGSSACPAAIASSQNLLLADVIGIYYNCYCLKNVDSSSNSIGRFQILKLFTDQVADNMPGSCCSFSTLASPNNERLSVPQYPGSKEKGRSSTCNWRIGIIDLIQEQARAAEKDLLRKVDEACYDLESRCYNTEAPLRQVEEERDQMISETRQLRTDNEDMRAQLQEASSTISRLEGEMADLRDHCDHLSKSSDNLTACLHDAGKQLAEQCHLSEKAIHAEREKARSIELGLLASRTERDDRIESLELEADYQRSTNQQLSRSLECVSKDKALALEEVSLASQEVAKLNEWLDGSKSELARSHEESRQSSADRERLKEVIHSLEVKASRTQASLEF